MDILESIIAILLILLPVFAFITGKVILRRKNNSEASAAADNPYTTPFIAGVVYAVFFFFLAAMAVASLINTINDWSVEFGILFVLVCAAGFIAVKAYRKFLKKTLRRAGRT